MPTHLKIIMRGLAGYWLMYMPERKIKTVDEKWMKNRKIKQQ